MVELGPRAKFVVFFSVAIGTPSSTIPHRGADHKIRKMGKFSLTVYAAPYLI